MIGYPIDPKLQMVEAPLWQCSVGRTTQNLEACDRLTWDASRQARHGQTHNRRRTTAYKTTASSTPARPPDRWDLAPTDADRRRLAAVDELSDRRDGCQMDRCRQRQGPTSAVTAADRRQHRVATAAVIPVHTLVIHVT